MQTVCLAIDPAPGNEFDQPFIVTGISPFGPEDFKTNPFVLALFHVK